MQTRCPACGTMFNAEGPGPHRCPTCGASVGPPPPPAGYGLPVGGPGAPPPPGQVPFAGREPTPWERRAELGAIKGLWLQWRDTLFKVDPFWKSVRPDGSIWDALSFAWIINVLGVLFATPLIALQMRVQGEQLRQIFDQMGRGADTPAAMQWFLDFYTGPNAWLNVAALGLFSAVVLTPIWLFAWAGIVHLMCLLFGCGKNGFGATFRAIAYATAPNVFSGVPCLNVLASLYSFVQMVWGVMRVQDTTGGRAAAGVLTPIAVFFCCFIGCYAFAVAAVISSMR